MIKNKFQKYWIRKAKEDATLESVNNTIEEVIPRPTSSSFTPSKDVIARAIDLAHVISDYDLLKKTLGQEFGLNDDEVTQVLNAVIPKLVTGKTDETGEEEYERNVVNNPAEAHERPIDNPQAEAERSEIKTKSMLINKDHLQEEIKEEAEGARRYLDLAEKYPEHAKDLMDIAADEIEHENKLREIDEELDHKEALESVIAQSKDNKLLEGDDETTHAFETVQEETETTHAFQTPETEKKNLFKSVWKTITNLTKWGGYRVRKVLEKPTNFKKTWILQKSSRTENEIYYLAKEMCKMLNDNPKFDPSVYLKGIGLTDSDIVRVLKKAIEIKKNDKVRKALPPHLEAVRDELVDYILSGDFDPERNWVPYAEKFLSERGVAEEDAEKIISDIIDEFDYLTEKSVKKDIPEYYDQEKLKREELETFYRGLIKIVRSDPNWKPRVRRILIDNDFENVDLIIKWLEEDEKALKEETSEKSVRKQFNNEGDINKKFASEEEYDAKYKEFQREAKKIVNKLQQKVSRGIIYENFGQSELRDFEDKVRMSSLTYQDKMDLIDFLRNAIDNIETTYKTKKSSIKKEDEKKYFSINYVDPYFYLTDWNEIKDIFSSTNLDKVIEYATKNGIDVKNLTINYPTKGKKLTIDEYYNLYSELKNEAQKLNSESHNNNKNKLKEFDYKVRTSLLGTSDQFEILGYLENKITNKNKNQKIQKGVFFEDLNDDMQQAIIDYLLENKGVVEKPGRRSIHSAKWDRCVERVRESGSAVNPYAVCTAVLGEESFKSMSDEDFYKAIDKEIEKRLNNIKKARKTITLIPVRYGGGAYKVKVEGDDDWVSLHGKQVVDYEADAIAVDAKKDGYRVVKIDAYNPYVDYDKLIREEFGKSFLASNTPIKTVNKQTLPNPLEVGRYEYKGHTIHVWEDTEENERFYTVDNSPKVYFDEKDARASVLTLKEISKQKKIEGKIVRLDNGKYQAQILENGKPIVFSVPAPEEYKDLLQNWLNENLPKYQESANKVEEVWNRANENEKFVFKFGLFPVWVKEYNLSQDDYAELTSRAKLIKRVTKDKKYEFGYKCNLCGKEFVPYTDKQLINHLQAEHPLEAEKVKQVFDNNEDLMVWDYYTKIRRLAR